MEMTERDAIELVERTPLEELHRLDTDVVYQHVDYLARELPGPLDLYRRWEHQQWSATDLELETDRQQWAGLAPQLQDQLRTIMSGFFYGEQAVTDTLAPLLIGAPDEESRLFLATQVVDEARHAYFFARYFREVLGSEGTVAEMAERASRESASDAYWTIFHPITGELAASTDAVRRCPGDYAGWVRAVTVYHIMVESLLALTGQRLVLKVLRQTGLLPGFRSGFTAVTRDESRHVSYGIWALAQAVAAGHEAEITSVVDRTLQPCILIYANPQMRAVDARDLPPDSRRDPRDNWRFAIDSLVRRLRAAGVDQDYLADIERRGWTYVEEAVELYERIHGVEHPVRAWERGEVAANG